MPQITDKEQKERDAIAFDILRREGRMPSQAEIDEILLAKQR
jgi:hypothetical protein